MGQVTLRILHGDAEHVLRQSVPPGAGSATFTWTVPATAATGTWRVTAHDTPQESLDHARSNLQVAPQPPRVVHAERTTPAAVPWTTGTIGVEAHVHDHNAPVRVELYVEGDGLTNGPFPLHATTPAPDVHLAVERGVWDLGLPPGSYTLHLRVQDGEGSIVEHALPGLVVRDDVPPTLRVLTDTPGEVEAGHGVAVRVEAVDDVSVQHVHARLTDPDGATTTHVLEPDVTDARGSGTYAATLPSLDAPGTWTLHATATDHGGNTATAEHAIRVTDTQAPLILDATAETAAEPASHEAGRPLRFTARVQDVQDATVRLRIDGEATGTRWVPMRPGDGGDGVWEATATLGEPGTVQWRVEVVDAAGNHAATPPHDLRMVEDLEPSIRPLSPGPGGSLRPGTPVVVEVLDSHLDPSSIQFRLRSDDTPWSNVAPLEPDAFETRLVPGGVRLVHTPDAEEGTPSFRLQAGDDHGNQAELEWSAALDDAPPTLRWERGGALAQPGVPLRLDGLEALTIQASDDATPRDRIRLAVAVVTDPDGAPQRFPAAGWLPHAPDAVARLLPTTYEGPADLVARATDEAGNHATATLRVLVDRTPPALDARVVDGHAALAAWDASGVASLTLHVHHDGAWTTMSLDPAEQAHRVPIPAAPRGTPGRLWLEATDPAGNHAVLGSPQRPVAFEHGDHAPTLTLHAVDGGVAWNATDLDGDPVRVRLVLDPDGDATVLLDDAPARGTWTTPDPSVDGVVLVEATDGVLTTRQNLTLPATKAAMEAGPDPTGNAAPAFTPVLLPVLAALAAGLRRTRKDPP